MDTILNVSELVNAVSGVKKQSKSGYFWDSDRFWIQILNVSELENAVSGVQNESKSGNRVPFGPPLPCGCNLVSTDSVKRERVEDHWHILRATGLKMSILPSFRHLQTAGS